MTLPSPDTDCMMRLQRLVRLPAEWCGPLTSFQDGASTCCCCRPLTAVLLVRVSDESRTRLGRAVELQPRHNAKASVHRAALARMVDPRRPDFVAESAAAVAIERVEAGTAYWYRLGGAHGGLSLDSLRARLGIKKTQQQQKKKKKQRRKKKEL